MPANAPINFDSTTSSTLAVPTAVRPSGVIRYHTATHSYKEMYTHADGSYQSIDAYVAWSDANDFIDYSIGFTEWDKANTTRFDRVVPVSSPFQAALRCDSCDLQEYGMLSGSITTDSANNRWPTADWARYSLVYRHREYAIHTDAEIDGSELPWAAYECKELGRYVERLPRFVTQELKLGNYFLETYNAAVPSETPQQIPQPGFVPFHTGEILYVWHQVPYEAIPLQAVGEASGYVNEDPFDKWYNGTAWVDLWPAQTLLFKGIGEIIRPKPGPSGELYTTVTYVFGYQPRGWNKFPQANPALAWKDVRRVGVNAPLYPTTDFRPLFRPRVI